MKRKLKWLAIVLAVSLLGFGTALFLLPRDRITAESWKQIRLGMTVEEVEAILHGPGLSWKEYEAKEMEALDGGQALMANEVLEEPIGGFLANELDKTLVWRGRHGELGVQVDREGHVRLKYFKGGQIVRGIDPTIFGRLRDWLGW